MHSSITSTLVSREANKGWEGLRFDVSRPLAPVTSTAGLSSSFQCLSLVCLAHGQSTGVAIIARKPFRIQRLERAQLSSTLYQSECQGHFVAGYLFDGNGKKLMKVGAMYSRAGCDGKLV